MDSLIYQEKTLVDLRLLKNGFGVLFLLIKSNLVCASPSKDKIYQNQEGIK
jgi:hypothetical protein